MWYQQQIEQFSRELNKQVVECGLHGSYKDRFKDLLIKGHDVGPSWTLSNETKIPQGTYKLKKELKLEGPFDEFIEKQKNMKKFKTPLSIEASPSELSLITEKLKKLGYIIYPAAMSMSHFPTIDYVYLNTNYPSINTTNGNSDKLGIGPKLKDHFILTPQTEDLILALAAMVDDEKFYEGEYVVSLINNGPRRSYLSTTEGVLYKILGDQFGDDSSNKFVSIIADDGDKQTMSTPRFRKATKEEIINQFNKQNMALSSSQQCVSGPQPSTVEVSIDFVKKAHAAACNDWKQKIEEAVPSVFPKLFYSVGQRFKHKDSDKTYMIIGGRRNNLDLALIVDVVSGELNADSRAVSNVKKITQRELELLFADRAIDVDKVELLK